MYRNLALCLAVSLTPFAACTGSSDDDSSTSACETTVALFPSANETRAYYRTDIVATFTPAEVPTGATISVTGPDGNVAGTTATVGRRLVFTPSSPLTPGADYTTNVEFDCDGATQTPSASWTVSEVGSPTVLGDLVGNAYALDLAGANFVEPEGVGALLGSFLNFDLLVGVVSTTSTEIEIVGALGVDNQPGVQEPCLPSIPFPPADITENPYFELGPQNFTINVAGTEVTIDELFLSGAFSPDGDYIDGVVLAGIVDTRPFKDLVDGSADAPDSAVCDLAVSLGVNCVMCPDNSGTFCIRLLATDISATSISGEVEVIDDPCDKEECASDPACVEE